VLGRGTDLTTLPWVGHHSRRWEPEPLRFLASRAIVRVLESADVHEDSHGTLVISPYARKGVIDHQTLSFDAYAKFMGDTGRERRDEEPRLELDRGVRGLG
jgi:hypothetical protein